jgi:formate hydrogenlyase subunit 4
MEAMRQTIAYNIIQVLFVLGLAPLYSGVLSRFKEIIQGKRGPSIFQPLGFRRPTRLGSPPLANRLNALVL